MRVNDYPEPPEKPVVLCEECGEECDYIYLDQIGREIGCDSCLESVFACDIGLDYCPVCGYACDMVMKNRAGEVVGCDSCLSEYRSYDYRIMEEY